LARRAVIGPSTAVPLIIPIGETALAAAALLAWYITDEYYLGWQACYCSLLLISTGVVSLIGRALTRGNFRATSVRHTRIDIALISQACAGVAGVIATWPVHEWNLTILDTSLVVTTAGISAGAIVSTLVFRPRRRRFTQPNRRIEHGNG
jgi:hypothetical protein